MEKRRKELLEKIEEIKQHSTWHSRYKDESKHFKFEFTVTPEIAKGYMDFFEEYWDVFSKQWRIRQPPRLGKLKICIYSNEKEFNRIGNVPRGVLGYFRFVEPLELNFFHDRKDPKFTRAVLWHECNHYLMHLYTTGNVKNPGWLEEGLAEYFGGSEYDAKTKRMTPGLTQEGRLVLLKDAMVGNDYKKLDKLLVKPRIDAMEYGWSWALCHMFFTKEYKKRFLTFIKGMAKSRRLPRETYPANPGFRWVKPDAQVKFLKSTLKVKDLGALEKKWYDYIKKMKVGSAFGYVQAARQCRRWERPLRAKVYYEKALKADPDYLPIYEAFADHLLDRDEEEEAKKVIERGLKLDPLNPGLYLMLGRYYKSQKKKAEAQRFCNLAMDLAPANVDVRFQAQNILY